MRIAVELGRKALTMDDSEYLVHCVYGEIMDSAGKFELAESHFIRALKLNPNDVVSRSTYALLLIRRGRPEEAVQHMAVAERLDPFGLTWTPWAKGIVMFEVGRYQEAIRCLSKIENLCNLVRPWLAAAFSKIDDLAQARHVLEKFFNSAQDDMDDFPGRNSEIWFKYLHDEMIWAGEEGFQDIYHALLKADWQKLIDALPDSADDQP